MPSLYELTAEFETLSMLAQTAIDEDDQQAYADTLEGLQMELEAKVDGCCCVMRDLDKEVAGCKAEIDRLNARKKTLENNAARLKQYVQEQLQKVGITKMKTPRFNVTIAKGQQRCEISDESALPFEMIRTKTEPDKAAIKAALKAGQDVPGAALVQGESSLRVR